MREPVPAFRCRTFFRCRGSTSFDVLGSSSLSDGLLDVLGCTVASFDVMGSAFAVICRCHGDFFDVCAAFFDVGACSPLKALKPRHALTQCHASWASVATRRPHPMSLQPSWQSSYHMVMLNGPPADPSRCCVGAELCFGVGGPGKWTGTPATPANALNAT